MLCSECNKNPAILFYKKIEIWLAGQDRYLFLEILFQLAANERNCNHKGKASNISGEYTMTPIC